MLVHLAAVWCVIAAQTLSLSLPYEMLDKRFHYLNMPIARVLEEGGLLREAIRRMHPETRPKRYGTDIDEVMFEDPSAKRTSLKRLAILSARGFGRK